MIAWLLTSWIGQIAAVVFAAWFLHGLWKATMRPRVTLVSYTELKERTQCLLAVRRNELLPPWRTLEETWLLEVRSWYCVRESDGRRITSGNSGLAESLHGLWDFAQARAAETDELIADEKRRTN
jgi:hypothetical protein